MTNGESQPRLAMEASSGRDSFIDSYAFLGLILALFFAVAIALSIGGLAQPSWLGFS